MTVTVTGIVELGDTEDGDGTYNLFSGQLDVFEDAFGDGGPLAVGQDGFGGFFHHSGNNLVDEDLILGEGSGSDGFYELTNGLVVTGSELSIGRDGIGRFVQNGGTVDVGSSLDLADDDPASEGTYELNSGVLTTSDGVDPARS